MSAALGIRDAPLGGQAVLEGVMMRGVGTWAVAVRVPAAPGTARGAGGAGGEPGPIRVSSFAITGAGPRVGAGSRAGSRGRVHQLAVRLPLVRGVVALWDSLSIGARALVISANAQLAALSGEDPAQTEIPRGVWIGSAVISLCFAVGLFFVVPVGATSLIRRQLGTAWLFWLVEGVLRTAIFLAYLGLLSRMRELRRVLEYHGAEHKVISCHEAGDVLTPQRAAGYSRLHPRCGTSFLLVVMIISIFVFAPIGLPAWWVLVLTRIAGVPVIAGLSFEVIRWVGRHRETRPARWLMWPGLRLQLLTTREPDLEQLAVSIASLEAVLAAERPGEWAAEELLGLEVVA
jgi:uncharacterized protein YqhQ